MWITHVAGALIGFGCITLIPSVTMAAACAITLIHLLMQLLRITHAPAGATTLLFLLGTHSGLTLEQQILPLIISLVGMSISTKIFINKKATPVRLMRL